VCRTIYFDNAATSWPKPQSVIEKMNDFMKDIGANPGRSGHSMSVEAGRIVFNVREKIARFFGLSDSARVIFTSNATHSLNLAMKGILKTGDHVITSSMEHNSVIRPLSFLRQNHEIDFTMVKCEDDGFIDLKAVESSIRSNTKLTVVIHGSNVAGTIMPVKEIGRLSKERGIIFLVDAAQTAGSIPIDMQRDSIDILSFTGHKGLFGPQGIGGLCVGKDIDIKPLMQGGTGSKSKSDFHPDFFPDRLEAGTLNTVGIAGLGAGIDYIEKVGVKEIEKHKKMLVKRFIDGLRLIDGITVYGPDDIDKRCGVVAFNIDGKSPGEVGYILDREYGIMSRVGLHCAPHAHKTIGSFPEGTVRFSFSYFNTIEDIDNGLYALKKI